MRLILAAAAISAAIAGSAAAETRSHSNFNRVSAGGGFDVQVTVGPAYSVEVTGPETDRVITEVRGNVLSIHPRQGWNWGHRRDRYNIRVTMPAVEGLEASSGSDLVATGVNAATLWLDASSGADLRVSGSCQTLHADASSGADLDARALSCVDGGVDASSGAGATVAVSGRLNVDASSGGNVYFVGEPRMGDISLSSGGSLRRR